MSDAETSRDATRLSVVIPVFNEADNVLPLLDEILEGLAGLGRLEVIFVDDCSDDDTVLRLSERLGGGVRLLRHDRRSGQSAAVRTGVRAAKAGWVATLDGDGQNDPADIRRLIEAAEADAEHPVMVGGLRLTRRAGWSKRFASVFANGLRSALLRDGCVDTGCGIKLFRRDVFLELPFFGALHRFLPALFRAYGHRVIYLPVNDRPRLRGQSKYGNLRRALIGILDLLGVYWLTRRVGPVPAVTEPGGN
ncbi:MAG: glycosyltransferase [Azospirillum sp.]|nr:glycosyltransferase [Azospirillum sp.]